MTEYQSRNEDVMSAIIEVDDKSFEEEVLKSDKIVLVDYWAQWCGYCLKMNPTIEKFAEENPDVKVVKMNIDDNPKTPAIYKIRSIPCLMVFKDGVSLGFQGSSSLADLEKFVASKTTPTDK